MIKISPFSLQQSRVLYDGRTSNVLNARSCPVSLPTDRNSHWEKGLEREAAGLPDPIVYRGFGRSNGLSRGGSQVFAGF